MQGIIGDDDFSLAATSYRALRPGPILPEALTEDYGDMISARHDAGQALAAFLALRLLLTLQRARSTLVIFT